MRRLARLGAALLASTLWFTVALPEAGEAETAVFSGACTLEVQATFSAQVTTTPMPRSLTIQGSGSCVVNGAVAPMSLDGVMATTPLTGGYSCLGGVATGTGVVHIAAPGFPDPIVQLTAAQTGGVVTLAVLALVLRFDGVAVLTQDPTDAAACLTAGYRSTTWDGGMAFQDPYPPPL